MNRRNKDIKNSMHYIFVRKLILWIVAALTVHIIVMSSVIVMKHDSLQQNNRADICAFLNDSRSSELNHETVEKIFSYAYPNCYERDDIKKRGITKGAALVEAYTDEIYETNGFKMPDISSDKYEKGIELNKLGAVILGREITYNITPVEFQGKRMRLYTCFKLNYYIYYLKYILVLDCMLVVAALLLSYFDAARCRMRIMKEEFITNLINNLAHDLKTPLSVASGCAENLYSNVHSDKREYYAEAVIKNINYANSIINKSLDYLKTNNRKVRRENIDCSISEIITDIWERYESVASERRLTCSLNGFLNVKGDRQLLEQLFDNILSNAVKYSKENTEVKVVLIRNMIEISNVCAVIPETDTSELIEPFVKGNSERSSSDSNGLGLAIASNIAHLHDFSLSVEVKENIFIVKISV